jgi:alpha-L-rhamnosidase
MLELSRDGYTQVAYQALTNPHLQQWLYSVTNGTPGVFQETTISEHGNSYISGPGGGYLSGDNSFNHCALGSVGEWIYKTVGGVSADELDTGYRNALVRPQAGGGVTNSATSLSQIRGPITVAWTNDVNARILRLGLTNPANTTASLYFPTTNLTSILEGSAPATNSTGVLFYQLTNGWALFKVGAGGYSFTVTNIVLGP